MTKEKKVFFFDKSVIFCVGGLGQGPGPWSGSGLSERQPEVRSVK